MQGELREQNQEGGAFKKQKGSGLVLSEEVGRRESDGGLSWRNGQEPRGVEDFDLWDNRRQKESQEGCRRSREAVSISELSVLSEESHLQNVALTA